MVTKNIIKEVPKEVSKEEQARELLMRASEEIRSLRSRVSYQGAQLSVLDKLAHISGWQEGPQGASPDICWEIDRFVRPPSLPTDVKGDRGW